MRRARSRAAALAAALVCLTTAAGAQPTGSVAIFGPPGDTLRSVTPTFTVQVSGLTGARPVRITLQLDPDPQFDGTPAVERTIEVADSGSTFLIAPARPLPQGARLYFRAVVSDPAGFNGVSLPAGPKIVPPWVTPVSPPVVPGQPVRSRTPRFVWRSPQINEPPGPWLYTISVTNLTRGTTIVARNLRDTTFTPGADLEASATYTWRISAAVSAGVEATTVVSPFTFLVEDPNVPVVVTELYPPFPNPFPGLIADASCIWFDLRRESTVNLDVHDLRGLHVRRLVPNGDLSGVLPPGRYGRGRTETSEGCDGRVAWDGRDDRGETVPEGVYLIRFRADGIVRTKKVLFRGSR